MWPCWVTHSTPGGTADPGKPWEVTRAVWDCVCVREREFVYVGAGMCACVCACPCVHVCVAADPLGQYLCWWHCSVMLSSVLWLCVCVCPCRTPTCDKQSREAQTPARYQPTRPLRSQWAPLEHEPWAEARRRHIGWGLG